LFQVTRSNLTIRQQLGPKSSRNYQARQPFFSIHVHLISHESILLSHHHLQLSIKCFALIVGATDGTLLAIMDSVGNHVGQKITKVVKSWDERNIYVNLNSDGTGMTTHILWLNGHDASLLIFSHVSQIWILMALGWQHMYFGWMGIRRPC